MTGTASAYQDIPVPDAGFDDHVLNNPGDYVYIGDAGYTGAWKNIFPGSAAWVDYGYYAADGDLPALSGNNKLFATYPEGIEDYVYQILDETFVEGATYTLSVWVGIAWSGYSDGWSLFFTGEDHTVNLSEISGSAPVGSWGQVSLDYTATAADAGKKIGIKIQSTAEYVTFEDVTLSLLEVVQGASYIWNGIAGDGLWDTPGNWTVTDSIWTWPNEEAATAALTDPNTGLGYLDISGTAMVTVVDDLRIDQGVGYITIGGDATVSVGDEIYVGDNVTGVGTLDISGNAVVNVADDLYTDEGEGHITITENAVVDIDDLVLVENDNGIGFLEISGNATVNVDDFKIVEDANGTGSLLVSGNAVITCDDFIGNDDGGDPSSSTVTLDGGTVIVKDDTTFNDDNPGTATVTINSGSWLGNDRINVSDNLDSTVHVTINGGQMICNALRLGEGGGEDIGQIRINLNGGTLQANNLSINITDTQIIYTGGQFRIASDDVNEVEMQQLITDGTIIADGAYSIVTDGDFTVLNHWSPQQAKLPVPGDGAEGVLLGTTLVSGISWVAGDTAATHDVYFGTTNPPAFIGNQEATTYYPGPTEVGTTYYWQIDEIEADGTTKHAGEVWSYTTTTDLSTVSEIATQPSPADGAGGVATDATLGWWPGSYAVSHDVYFGTANPPALLGNTTGFNSDPGALAKDTTYYWRVDAIDAAGTVHTGDVWSFATVLDIPVTDPHLLVWWSFDEDAGTAVIDHSGHDRYGTVNGTTWVADGKVGGAMDFSGGGDDVVDDDASYLNGLSAISFAVWIKSDVTNTDRGFIICEDPEGNDSHDMRYDKAGATAGGTDVLKMAVTSTGGEQQIESSDGLQTTEWQHCVMVWSSGEQLKFYVNGMLDTPTTNSDATTGTTTGYVKLIAGKGKDGSSSAGWDGMIDDLRIYDIALSQGEIMALAGLVKAYSPAPVDGENDALKTSALSWSAGGNAVSHDVYFGTDEQAVIDGTAFIGNQTATSYDPPGDLVKGTTYYWRVDEVEADGTIQMGDLWSFRVTTAGR